LFEKGTCPNTCHWKYPLSQPSNQRTPHRPSENKFYVSDITTLTLTLTTWKFVTIFMGRLKIGTTTLTDYENETHNSLLDLFLHATEVSEVIATETDACFLTTWVLISP
jgi:hypothetical protein